MGKRRTKPRPSLAGFAKGTFEVPAGTRLMDPRDDGFPLNFVASNGFLDAEGHPIPGVCCVCGCEEDNACENGCEWVNMDQTLCSSCLTMLGRIPLRLMRHYTAILPPIRELGACAPLTGAKHVGHAKGAKMKGGRR